MKVGDIIEEGSGHYYLVGGVNTLGGFCDDCSIDRDKIKIIGNIFDDPELLEKYKGELRD